MIIIGLTSQRGEMHYVCKVGASGAGSGAVHVGLDGRLWAKSAEVDVASVTPDEAVWDWPGCRVTTPPFVPISAIVVGARRDAPLVSEDAVCRAELLAMLPFCGYNMGVVAMPLFTPPPVFRAFRVFRVNVLCAGDEIRALEWIVERLTCPSRMRFSA